MQRRRPDASRGSSVCPEASVISVSISETACAAISRETSRSSSATPTARPLRSTLTTHPPSARSSSWMPPLSQPATKSHQGQLPKSKVLASSLVIYAHGRDRFGAPRSAVPGRRARRTCADDRQGRRCSRARRAGARARSRRHQRATASRQDERLRRRLRAAARAPRLPRARSRGSRTEQRRGRLPARHRPGGPPRFASQSTGVPQTRGAHDPEAARNPGRTARSIRLRSGAAARNPPRRAGAAALDRTPAAAQARILPRRVAARRRLRRRRRSRARPPRHLRRQRRRRGARRWQRRAHDREADGLALRPRPAGPTHSARTHDPR